jgi:hypothetical protein
VYPLLIKRRYTLWHWTIYWTSATRLECFMLGLYFFVNGFFMGYGIHKTNLKQELFVRSGTMAIINMIPLFLGGRTNILSNFLGISFHTYYLAHHWIGRMVIVLSILHIGLHTGSGKPSSYMRSQVSALTVSILPAGRE